MPKPMSLKYITSCCGNKSTLPHDAFVAFVDHMQQQGYQYGIEETSNAWSFFLDGWRASRAHVIKQVQTLAEGLQ